MNECSRVPIKLYLLTLKFEFYVFSCIVKYSFVYFSLQLFENVETILGLQVICKWVTGYSFADLRHICTLFLYMHAHDIFKFMHKKQ